MHRKTYKNKNMPNEPRLRIFDLTIKAEGTSHLILKDIFKKHCVKWSFQREKGEETGYDHYQARVNMKERLTLNKARHYWLQHISAFNLTPTHDTKTFNYVTKTDTRTEGPWNWDDREPLKTVDRMTEHGLYPWQAALKDKVKNYDDRHIHIVIDFEGNHGKSAFTKYMWYNKLALPVPPMRTAEDLVQFVNSCATDETCFIIDMPRAMKKKSLYELYSGIETIKNGLLYDKRYKGTLKYIDEPNIIVFTNACPKLKYLSRDRWCLWTIDKENSLVNFQVAKVARN